MPITLTNLLDPKQITLDLHAQTQSDAMRELIDLLAANGRIDNRETLLEQVRARELTNSTYAGDGVAFPHARTNLVDQIVLGVGRNAKGISWTGKGEHAHLIFLIGIPEPLISDYLVVVGAIARVTRDKPLRTLLLHAETVPEFIQTMLAAPSL